MRDQQQRDNQRGERQHIAVESPLKITQVRMQILAQRNQRHIHHCDVRIHDREHHSDHKQR
jgi:hypothetical protein